MDIAESVARFGPNLEGLFKVGVVTQISGNKVWVTVSGEPYLLNRASHYTPTVNDTVQVLWIPGRPFVFAKIA